MKRIQKINDLQELKRELLDRAEHTRYDYQGFQDCINFLYTICDIVIELGGFASGIAETVSKSIGKYMKAAYLSEKQAYWLSRALIEGGVTEIIYNS